MLRSESMGYYELVMPRESAWEVMNALGKSASLIKAKSIASILLKEKDCRSRSSSR